MPDLARNDTAFSPPLSAADFHVLLVLANRSLYGYAILKAVARASGGTVRPDLGSLYRSLARLEAAGWVSEVEAPRDEAPAPGKPRRYFNLSAVGHQVLTAEAERLRAAVALADRTLPKHPQATAGGLKPQGTGAGRA